MNEIGNNLKRIRLLKNLSLKEAGNLLNMSAPAISKYEKGEIKVNSQKVIEFANVYGVKTVELLKPNSNYKMKFNNFRKSSRLNGERLELLKNIIELKVSDYINVVSMNNIDNKVHLKHYDVYSMDDAEKIGDKFRNNYKLSLIQPISDLISVLENLGIIIVEIDNTNNNFYDFDGLSEIVNNIPVIVVLKDQEDGARQRFTIAHELGHLLLNIKDRELDEEKVCNKFAASLLMPRQSVMNEFGNKRKNVSFYELKSFKLEYRVSIASIIYRLKELNIISEYTFKKLNAIYTKLGFKKCEPNNIEPEKSYQFNKIVHKLETDDVISLNKACELLGVTINEYNEENYSN